MKNLLPLLILLPFINGSPFLKTLKYAGSYSYGKDIEKGRVGSIEIYPETDSTILFYLDLNRGAPSYNMGTLYGRSRMINNKGVFQMNDPDTSRGCKFSLFFYKNILVIKTLEDKYDCPFGYGVIADGTFKRISNKVPKYFIAPEGDTIYFKKTGPEKYNAN